MIVKIGLEKIILKFHKPLQRYLLTCQANSALLWAVQCWTIGIIFYFGHSQRFGPDILGMKTTVHYFMLN